MEAVKRHALFFALTWAVSLSAQAAPAFNGMSYTAFGPANVLDTSGSNASLLKMEQMGANTVALNVWWFQTAYNSNSVQEEDNRYSATMSSIADAVDYIHNTLGMKVLLKPMLDVDDGNWRAYISPTDPATWFGYNASNPFVKASSAPLAGSYGDYLGKMADLAQQHHVEMFSIGCEMNNLENVSNLGRWTNLISNVRSRYSGPLTYSANWSTAGAGPAGNVAGGYNTVPFWNQLDDVGIDAYFNLTNSNTPTQTQLNSAWTNIANTIQTWRSNSANGAANKPLIFTETGYASYDGSNKTPYSGPGSQAVDTNEQSMTYRALMTVMSQQPWWDGAFWWNWTTSPTAGGTSDKNYTPQNKPAQQVLSEFYLRRGDFDLDHQLSNADLQAMLTALKNTGSFKSTYFFSDADLNALGDFNGDGTFTVADLSGELSLLPRRKWRGFSGSRAGDGVAADVRRHAFMAAGARSEIEAQIAHQKCE